MDKLNSSSYCVKCVLKHTIHLKPNEIKKGFNIKEVLKNQLINKVGDRCVKDGYVVGDSIEIIKYSIGELCTAHFTGDIRFSILYTALIYNPSEKDQLTCKIINKNKMGILAEAGVGNPAPISILLSKQHHPEKDIFKDLDVGKTIHITVIGKRYELNDKQIFVIGKLINSSNLAGGAKISITEKMSKEDLNHLLVSPWLTNGLPQDINFNKDLPEDITNKFKKIVNRLYEIENWEDFSYEEKVAKFFNESNYSPLFSDVAANAIVNMGKGIDAWYTISNKERDEFMEFQIDNDNNTNTYTPYMTGLYASKSSGIDIPKKSEESSDEAITDDGDISEIEDSDIDSDAEEGEEREKLKIRYINI